MAELPKTDHAQVLQLRHEYESLLRQGHKDSSEACFRLTWALVHSQRSRDVEEGLKLANALLEGGDMDDARRKDLVYFCCVAEYNLGRYVSARTQVTEFLKVAPNNRQAQHLKELVEEKVMREGMIGLGILGVGAAAAAVVAAVVVGRR